MAVDASGAQVAPDPQAMGSAQSATDQKLDKLISVVTAQQADFRAMRNQMENMAREFGVPKEHQGKTDEATQCLLDTLAKVNLDSRVVALVAAVKGAPASTSAASDASPPAESNVPLVKKAKGLPVPVVAPSPHPGAHEAPSAMRPPRPDLGPSRRRRTSGRYSAQFVVEGG